MSSTKRHDDEVHVGLVVRLIARQFSHWVRLALDRVASAGTRWRAISFPDLGH